MAQVRLGLGRTKRAREYSALSTTSILDVLCQQHFWLKTFRCCAGRETCRASGASLGRAQGKATRVGGGDRRLKSAPAMWWHFSDRRRDGGGGTAVFSSTCVERLPQAAEFGIVVEHGGRSVLQWELKRLSPAGETFIKDSSILLDYRHAEEAGVSIDAAVFGDEDG